MRWRIITVVAMTPTLAFSENQEVQLQPQFYMPALQQYSTSCTDEAIKLRGMVMQYAAEIADLKKRLAEAETKVPQP